MKEYSTNVMWIGLSLYLLAVLTTSATEMLPTFLEEPESAVISHHASVTLPCKVAPSDSVVRWKFNGELIPQTTHSKGKWEKLGFTFLGTNLHIENFKHKKELGPSHVGIYQCIAETHLGSVTSRPAKLSKAVLKRFQSRDDLDLNVTEGHMAVLPCQPPDSSPTAIIRFEFNGILLNEPSDHHSILSTGNLLLHNATMKDQGQYRCVAINPLTNKNRTAGHVINLHVKNPLSVPSQAAVFVTMKTIFKARIGDNVTLECAVMGNPQPNITWDRYGGEWSPTRHIIINGNLMVLNINESDAGTYVCKANNSIGEPKVKAVVLELLETPKVKAETEFVTVNPGESVRLKCDITGSSDAEVMWYHNAVPISDLLTLNNGGKTFSINDIQPYDAGLYQCMCSNDVGVSYSVINLEVKGQDNVSGNGSTANGRDSDVSSHPSGKGGRRNNASSHGNGSAGRKHKGGRRCTKKRQRKNRCNMKDPELKDQGKGKSDTAVEVKSETAGKVKLVPATAPKVSQLSDTSVMLEWEVPPNNGLDIVFYRAQYKLIKPEKGRWQTEDVEIPEDRRVYEVSNLQRAATYKFRIAAVYSNDDNKAGPNSKRFTLKVKPYKKPPEPEGRPTIVKVEPVEFEQEHVIRYGLNVKWKYQQTKSSRIEGFFLHYKPYGVNADYERVQMTRPMARTYLLEDLLSNTEYSIKIQSFNAAGGGRFSNTVVKRTKGGKGGPVTFKPPMTVKPATGDSFDSHDDPSRTEEQEPTKTDTQTSSEMLYMILGIVLGVMMLLLIIFMFMCWWKQRQQRRMMDAMNDAVRSKFQDPAQRIYADSLRKKYAGMNGVNNGIVGNGHVPNAYTKMNININPLSEMETRSNGHGGHLSNHYQHNSFIPNGSVPSHPSGSDNNFNKINRNVDGSLQQGVDHMHDSLGGEDCLQSPDSLGGGEAPACPPSPQSSNVPSCFEPFHTDSTGRYSNSNRSCDQLAGSHDCLEGNSSLNSDSVGGNHMNKHKRQRRRPQNKEQSTRDQATNTDLSSNEGTIEFSTFNKVPSSTHISHDGSPPQTYAVDPLLSSQAV